MKMMKLTMKMGRWRDKMWISRSLDKTSSKLLFLLSRRVNSGIGRRTVSSQNLPKCPLLEFSLPFL